MSTAQARPWSVSATAVLPRGNDRVRGSSPAPAPSSAFHRGWHPSVMSGWLPGALFPVTSLRTPDALCAALSPAKALI